VPVKALLRKLSLCQASKLSLKKGGDKAESRGRGRMFVFFVLASYSCSKSVRHVPAISSNGMCCTRDGF
jgi:hypothetical protein